MRCHPTRQSLKLALPLGHRNSQQEGHFHGDQAQKLGIQQLKGGATTVGENLDRVPQGRDHWTTGMQDLKGVDEISEDKAVKQLLQMILEDRDQGGTIHLITAMERWFSVRRYMRKSVTWEQTETRWNIPA